MRFGPSASQLHRFGPSGPWPWASFSKNSGRSDNADDIPARETERGVRPSLPEVGSAEEDPETEWRNYPASHFPNWTRSVLERSNLIAEVFELEHTSTNIQTIDGYRDGQLRAGITFYGGQEEEFWAAIRQPVSYAKGRNRVAERFRPTFSSSLRIFTSSVTLLKTSMGRFCRC